MIKGFNLSNRIFEMKIDEDVISVRDVKEFIKNIKEGCSTFISAGSVCSVIDKLAGDTLSQEKA